MSHEAVVEGQNLHLRNLGSAVVSGLTVECTNDRSVFFSDGCLMLLLGEAVTIRMETMDPIIENCPLYLSGLHNNLLVWCATLFQLF